MARTLRWMTLLLLAAAVRGGIHQAMDKNDLEAVKRGVAAGELNLKSAKHHTPVMRAVLEGRPKLAEYLISAGADLSITDAVDPGKKDDGYTPIHAAGFKGDAKIMAMLIDAGEDPNHKHMDGYTPLHRALWSEEARHTETVQVILDKCGKRCAATLGAGGDSPLQMASESGGPKSLKIMKAFAKAHGLSTNLQSKASEKSPEQLEYEKIFQQPNFVQMVQQLFTEYPKLKQEELPMMLMSVMQSEGGMDVVKDLTKFKRALKKYLDLKFKSSKDEV